VRCLLAFFLCAVSCTTVGNNQVKAAEKPPVHWLIWRLTPEFIETGEFAGKGYADKFLKFFIKNLPGYEHHKQWTNVRRWNTEALKPNRCSPHIWGHYYPDKMVLSKPYTFTAPQMVIFSKRHRARFGPEDTVLSLQDLLTQEDLKLVTPRLYTDRAQTQVRYPVIHRYLEPYLYKTNLAQLAGLTNEADLRLLSRGRADYTIGYPTVITAQKRVHNIQGEFVAYHIKEHDFYTKIYVSCSDSKFGRELIGKINNLLTEKNLRVFLEYQEEWNGENKRFREVTEQHLILGKKVNNVVD